MSRQKGTFDFSSNFEIVAKAPLDARVIVDTKANLISPAIWGDVNMNVWLYKGIVVSVVSDPSPNNNGLYFLKDETTYTSYDSWLKVISNTGSIDSSGTSSVTFQLNNGNNGVLLKDNDGNLEVVTIDGSTFANIQAGTISINAMKLDNANGVLYAVGGNIYSQSDSFPLKAYQGFIVGNGITNAFTIDHNLNTLRQTTTIYDSTNNVIYPELSRGVNTNIISFIEAPQMGVNYEIIILGF